MIQDKLIKGRAYWVKIYKSMPPEIGILETDFGVNRFELMRGAGVKAINVISWLLIPTAEELIRRRGKE